MAPAAGVVLKVYSTTPPAGKVGASAKGPVPIGLPQVAPPVASQLQDGLSRDAGKVSETTALAGPGPSLVIRIKSSSSVDGV